MKNAFLLVIFSILSVIFSVQADAVVKIEKIKYGIYGQCYSISNNHVQVIVSTDTGPRIISYRLLSGKNVFRELNNKAMIKMDSWKNYPCDGHRLLHTPEVFPRSFVSDDSPVTVKQIGKNTLWLKPAVEKYTGIQKEMLVRLDDKGSGVEVTHYLTNKGILPIEIAPRTLTVMLSRGEAIIPDEPNVVASMLPASKMNQWYDTNPNDSQLDYKTTYTMIRCEDNIPISQVGFKNRLGWIGYIQAGNFFIKRFDYDSMKTYPDGGFNNEVFVSGSLIQIETLGYMRKLESGKTATHIERWYLFNNMFPGTYEVFDSTIQRHLKQTKHVGR